MVRGQPARPSTLPATRTSARVWIRSLAAPVREFLRTETVGAVVLAAATVLALVWGSVDRITGRVNAADNEYWWDLLCKPTKPLF